MTVSRVPLSSLSNGTILIAGTYKPAVGATAYVYEHGTVVQVSVYAAETGEGTLTQPVTSNANGQFPGYVLGEQDLDVVASYLGNTAAAAEAVPIRAADLAGIDSGTGELAVGSGVVPLSSAEKKRAETAEGLKSAKAENLKDLASAATARTNLELGTAATHAAGDFDATGAAASAQSAAEAASDVKGAAATAQGAAEAASIPASHLDAASGAAKLGTDKTVGGPGGSALSPSVVSSSTRRGMVSLCHAAEHVRSNAEEAIRVPLVVPASTVRWRLRIRNYNDLFSAPAAVLSGAEVKAIYLGEQEYTSAGLPSAAFVNAPVEVLPAFVLNALGNEYVSEWITAGANQLAAGVKYLLSYAYSGGGEQSCGPAPSSYTAIGAGTSAYVNQQAATHYTLTIGGYIPFDVRIEYEVSTYDKLTGLAIGDSTTEGVGSATAFIFGPQRWPERFAAISGHLMMNAGAASTQLTHWENNASWRWQRTNPGEVKYDFVIIDLGVNDVHGSFSYGAMQINFAKVVAQARLLGIKRIFANTIKPYNTGPLGLVRSTIATQVVAGATSIIVRDSIPTATVLQLGEGVVAESVTTNAEPTGTGPFTLGLSAGTTRGHIPGEGVAGAKEFVRWQFNDWLRELPCRIDGCFSTDAAVQAPYDRTAWNPSLTTQLEPQLHPNEAGHARIAGVIGPIESRV